jgi:hypothetical protein
MFEFLCRKKIDWALDNVTDSVNGGLVIIIPSPAEIVHLGAVRWLFPINLINQIDPLSKSTLMRYMGKRINLTQFDRAIMDRLTARPARTNNPPYYCLITIPTPKTYSRIHICLCSPAIPAPLPRALPTGLTAGIIAESNIDSTPSAENRGQCGDQPNHE